MISPIPRGEAVPEGFRWPDLSARTIAEVWRLSAEEVEAERQAHVPQDRDWRVRKVVGGKE